MTTRTLEAEPNAVLKGLFENDGDVEALSFVRDRNFLAKYMTHEDPRVRVAIASNPYVNQRTLRKLMLDPNRIVYTTAMRHPCAWVGDLVALAWAVRRAKVVNQDYLEDIRAVLAERKIDFDDILIKVGAF